MGEILVLGACLFCDIVQNDLPGSVVYEDEKVLALLDIRPINEGHTLVIPKKHYENIFDIPEEEISYLFKIVKRVACAVKKAVKAEGLTIVQNNGQASNQVIFHFHVHIIPKYYNQKTFIDRKQVESQELNVTACRIKKFI